MANSKLKKVLLWVLPLAAVGGILAFISAKDKKKGEDAAKSGNQVPAQGAGAPVPVPAPAKPPEFPLKNGSRNTYVAELQSALKLTADGVFGPKTEAALFALTGSKQVANVNDLHKIIAQAATGASNIARATDLITKFRAGGVALFTTSDAVATKVQQDAYNGIIDLGLVITLYKGKVYNNADYVPKIATKMGNLIFTVTRGALAGDYSVDPSKLTLVKV